MRIRYKHVLLDIKETTVDNFTVSLVSPNGTVQFVMIIQATSMSQVSRAMRGLIKAMVDEFPELTPTAKNIRFFFETAKEVAEEHHFREGD